MIQKPFLKSFKISTLYFVKLMISTKIVLFKDLKLFFNKFPVKKSWEYSCKINSLVFYNTSISLVYLTVLSILALELHCMCCIFDSFDMQALVIFKKDTYLKYIKVILLIFQEISSFSFPEIIPCFSFPEIIPCFSFREIIIFACILKVFPITII